MAFLESATGKRVLKDVYRTEWRIGCPKVMVLGTLDCFVVTKRDDDGSPLEGIVIDWKTSSRRHDGKGFTNRSVQFPRCEAMTKVTSTACRLTPTSWKSTRRRAFCTRASSRSATAST